MTHEDAVHLNVIMLLMFGAQQPGYRLFGPAAFVYAMITTKVVSEIAEIVAESHYHRGEF